MAAAPEIQPAPPDYWLTSLDSAAVDPSVIAPTRATPGDYVVFVRDGHTPVGWGHVDARSQVASRRSFDVPERVQRKGWSFEAPAPYPELTPVDGTALAAIIQSVEQFVTVWPPLPSLIDALSPSAHEALNSSLGLALRNGVPVVHMEHLLAGLSLKENGALRRVLAEAGKSADDLIAALENRFETNLQAPDSGVRVEALPRLSSHVLEAFLAAQNAAASGYIQHHVLLEGARQVVHCDAVQVLEDLLGSPDSSKKGRSDPQIARFLSDAADGKDQLDIEPYAQAMALLLVNREVDPPLSIGLFGDWGSGKSFFMRRVEHWVGEYGDRVNKETCCSEPVQIRFNAWQYVDADLWSSLVVHILDRISESLAPTPDQPEQTRKKLIEKLGAFGVRKSELELELEQAKLAAKQVRGRAERAAKERLRAQALLDAAESLGVLNDEGRKALAKELEKANGGFGLAFAGAARSPWTWTLLALAVFFGALGYFERLAVLLSAPPLAGVAWKVFTAYTRVRTAVNAGVQAETTPHDQAEIDRLQRVQDEAQATLNQLEADRARLQAQVENIDPRARLLELLERRTAYEKSQGLIAQVHTDFQKLEGLIAEVQSAAASDRPKVERIVLYIDDLDRCPPKRVVEVLQAVHLLLAFKLFVVVVAVDPRWLRRALEVHFPDLLLTEETEEASERRATPRDYLEKIFQIPFTLPPLEATLGGDYLASLAGAPAAVSAAASSAPEPVVAASSSAEPAQSSSESAPAAAAATPVGGEESKPARELERKPITPDRLALHELERDAIRRMAPFFTTPRAAKRFVNVYRLLRATTPVEDEERFLGTAEQPGTHRAAVLLCAIGVRFPELLERIEEAQILPNAALSRFLSDAAAEPLRNCLSAEGLEDFAKLQIADITPWFEPVRRFAFRA